MTISVSDKVRSLEHIFFEIMIMMYLNLHFHGDFSMQHLPAVVDESVKQVTKRNSAANLLEPDTDKIQDSEILLYEYKFKQTSKSKIANLKIAKSLIKLNKLLPEKRLYHQ